MSGFKPYDPNSGGGTAGVTSVTGSTVDNTDPANPVVDAIGPAPTDATYATQGDQWINAITISTSNMYSWDDDITATDPGQQKVKIDNADESLATNVYINETTLSGGSIQAIGNELVVGDLIRIQQYGATGNFVTFKVSNTPTDNGEWWVIPVSVLENSGGFVDGVDVSLDYWPTGLRSVSSNVYGTERHQDSDLTYTTTSNSFNSPNATNTKLSITTSSLPAGMYTLKVNFQFMMMKDKRFEAGIWHNNSLAYLNDPIKYKSDKNNDELAQSFYSDDLALSGVHTFELRYGPESNGDDATVGDAVMELIRVG